MRNDRDLSATKYKRLRVRVLVWNKGGSKGTLRTVAPPTCITKKLLVVKNKTTKITYYFNEYHRHPKVYT